VPRARIGIDSQKAQQNRGKNNETRVARDLLLCTAKSVSHEFRDMAYESDGSHRVRPGHAQRCPGAAAELEYQTHERVAGRGEG
jgi:hypothetical protein